MLTYEPLEHDDSFRLLRLLPGSITDPIRCSLETSRISRQHEKYLCLSYCWGEIKNLRPILCQGTKVFVTPTLFHALERLRLPHQVTTIWVDALCINQSREPAGLSERQEQVRLMSKIFGSAYCVIVDLGQHSDSWRWLVKLLPDFAGLNQETRHTSMIGPEPYGIPIARQRCNGEEEDHEAFDAMRDLLKSSWLRRAWTIQEFVLAKRVCFLLGFYVLGRRFIRGLRRLKPVADLVFQAQELDARAVGEIGWEALAIRLRYRKLLRRFQPTGIRPHDLLFCASEATWASIQTHGGGL